MKESKKGDKYLDLARELKEPMEKEDDGDPSCNWSLRNNLKSIGKGLEDFEINGKVETIQTTALLISAAVLGKILKNWGDLQSFNLHLMPVWKTPKGVKKWYTYYGEILIAMIRVGWLVGRLALQCINSFWVI